MDQYLAALGISQQDVANAVQAGQQLAVQAGVSPQDVQNAVATAQMTAASAAQQLQTQGITQQNVQQAIMNGQQFAASALMEAKKLELVAEAELKRLAKFAEEKIEESTQEEIREAVKKVSAQVEGAVKDASNAPRRVERQINSEIKHYEQVVERELVKHSEAGRKMLEQASQNLPALIAPALAQCTKLNAQLFQQAQILLAQNGIKLPDASSSASSGSSSEEVAVLKAENELLRKQLEQANKRAEKSEETIDKLLAKLG